VIRPPRPSAILIQVLLLAVAAPALAAQAVMVGVVRNDSTGAPIPGVEVLLNGTPHTTTTNAQGRYILAGLPAGTYQAFFRLIGHLPVRVDVRLTAGDTTRANTTLIQSEVVLDPIVVTGAPSLRGVGMGREALEERRRLGFGRFIDAEALRRYDTHLHLDDVLRRDSGAEVHLMKLDGFSARVAFHPARRDIEGRLNCIMSVYYNGVQVGVGGVLGPFGSGNLKPIDLRMYNLSGLDAIEVYRSAAEVPAEYGGASGACGVILLWSRLNR
jgi:hypothetical protein